MKLPKAVAELEFGHGSVYGEEEKAAVLEVLAANAPSCGPKVKQFEEDFASYCGSSYGLAVTSATTGLELAMIAADIGPGDEVITTPVSWISTANVISARGATAVFADVDPRNLNLDPASVATRITAKTKVILPVHLYGQCCDMDASTNLHVHVASWSLKMQRMLRAPSTKGGRPARWATSVSSASISRKTWSRLAKVAW